MANQVPSRSRSIARLVAARAASIFVHGLFIEPEQSRMSTWAAPGPASVPSGWAATLTMAWTADAPRGRYRF